MIRLQALSTLIVCAVVVASRVMAYTLGWLI